MGRFLNTPVDSMVVQSVIEESHVPDLGKATIREIVIIVNEIEARSGVEYIRMEMGVPGLEASPYAIDAEIAALKSGVASRYPMLEGVEVLKKEASRFVKAFLDVEIEARGCVPTVGSMQGSFAAFMVLGHADPKKDTFLFIDPGFPVQKQQLHILGFKYETFDVYHYRGEKLREKLEGYFVKGNIVSVIYSNPNNPSWVCLHEDELKIIGELANLYGVVVVEDLAYLAMDFRENRGIPFEPPYQPTVGKYTNNYLLLISSSKAFSYAGQRMAMLCISDVMFEKYYPALEDAFVTGWFGQVLVGRVLYALSAGASHSAQYGLAATFKAACDGDYDFVEVLREYEKRAVLMKSLFLANGFELVYSLDVDEPIADGFYFTVDFPGMSGGELVEALLYFGISAIPLGNTGSEREGIRACVSQTQMSRLGILESRLQRFYEQFRG